MFQNTKNTFYDTFNTLFYETLAETLMKHDETFILFAETEMFHFSFTGISFKSLKLFSEKYSPNYRETDMFQEMFHENQVLIGIEAIFLLFETFFWNKMSFTKHLLSNNHPKLNYYA